MQKNVKKSKREVNYLLGNGEEKQKMIVVEMQKKDPDLQLVDDLMAATFSKRRQEIVDQPLIPEVPSRWPALFHERHM